MNGFAPSMKKHAATINSVSRSRHASAGRLLVGGAFGDRMAHDGERDMKFDLKITTGVAAALVATACSQQDNGWTTDRDTALCVDKTGKRVPDDQCPRQAREGGYHGGSGIGTAFLWYYLGRNSVIPPYGEPVRGGSFSRVAGASYVRAPAATGFTRAGAISRGGFGSSARGGGGFGE